MMEIGLPGEYINFCQPIGRVHVRWAAFIAVTVDFFLSLFAFIYECAIYAVGGGGAKFFTGLFFFVIQLAMVAVFYTFWKREMSLKAKFTLNHVRLYLWSVFIHNLTIAALLVIVVGITASRMARSDRRSTNSSDENYVVSGLVLAFVAAILFLSKTISAYVIWRYYCYIVNQSIVREEIEGEELTEMQA